MGSQQLALYWDYSAGDIFFPYLEPFVQDRISTLEVVPYCEIRDNYHHHNGRLIKVHAELYFYQHGFFFDDAACRGVDDSAFSESWRTAVLFHEPNRQEIFRKIDEWFPSRREINAPIRVVAIGRFTYRRILISSSDGIEYRTPFHFELYSLEIVDR